MFLHMKGHAALLHRQKFLWSYGQGTVPRLQPPFRTFGKQPTLSSDCHTDFRTRYFLPETRGLVPTPFKTNSFLRGKYVAPSQSVHTLSATLFWQQRVCGSHDRLSGALWRSLRYMALTSQYPTQEGRCCPHEAREGNLVQDHPSRC